MIFSSILLRENTRKNVQIPQKCISDSLFTHHLKSYTRIIFQKSISNTFPPRNKTETEFVSHDFTEKEEEDEGKRINLKKLYNNKDLKHYYTYFCIYS